MTSSFPPPPPLSVQIAEEFAQAQGLYDDEREAIMESYCAHKVHRLRERDRVRKARKRAEVLAELRRVEGHGERTCPTCGVVFPVELHVQGRPQVHCSPQCALRAAWRAWWKRWA